MFERFTANARRAVFFARYEASQFGSSRIEVEHMLLALLRKGQSLGEQLSPETRLKIQKWLGSEMPRADPSSTSVDIPVSNALKQVFDWADEEATAMQHSSINSAHLLLAILRTEGSLAANILTEHGLRYDTYREAARLAIPAALEKTTARRTRIIDRAGPWDDPSTSSHAAAGLAESLLELHQLVDGTQAHLDCYTDAYGEQILKRRRWSRKQALGHLVDWATAHQQWIARALHEPKVLTSGYPPEHWVNSQHYATFAWRDLVDLWISLNRLLFHVIARIPEARLTTPCRIGIAAAIPLTEVIARYLEHCEEIVGEILTLAS